MATTITCDGCGNGIDGPPEKIGYVLVRDYCAPCAAIVAELGADIDALHTRLANSWREDLETTRAQYRTKLRQLPDDNLLTNLKQT
jgi:hypothetical protein